MSKRRAAKPKAPPPGKKRSPPHAPDADGQVRDILAEMQAGTWDQSSARRLAKRWGISLNSVRDRASEAARHLRLALDPQATLEQAVAQLEQMKLGAMADKQWSAAMKGAELWFKVRRFLDREPAPSLAMNFPSAREALSFVETIRPGLIEAAAAEAQQLPAGPGAQGVRDEKADEEAHRQEARQEHHQDDEEGGAARRQEDGEEVREEDREEDRVK